MLPQETAVLASVLPTRHNSIILQMIAPWRSKSIHDIPTLLPTLGYLVNVSLQGPFGSSLSSLRSDTRGRSTINSGMPGSRHLCPCVGPIKHERFRFPKRRDPLFYSYAWMFASFSPNLAHLGGAPHPVIVV